MKISYTGEIEVSEGFTWIRLEDGKRILIDEAFFRGLGEKKFIGNIFIMVDEITTGLCVIDRED